LEARPPERVGEPQLPLRLARLEGGEGVLP